MVKSVVVQMSKADCEAVGKGSLLELQTVKTDSDSSLEEEAKTDMISDSEVSEANTGLSEHHPGCYPTSTYTRNKLTCIKKCNRGCYASGLTCKKHCFKL